MALDHAAYLRRAVLICPRASSIWASDVFDNRAISQGPHAILELVALIELVHASYAGVVRALSVPAWTNPRAGAFKRESSAFAVVGTLVGIVSAKDLGAVPFKTVEAEFCGVLWDTLVFLAAFDH